MGNELHERTAVKVARCVLGRGEGGNTFSLFDYIAATSNHLRKSISGEFGLKA